MCSSKCLNQYNNQKQEQLCPVAETLKEQLNNTYNKARSQRLSPFIRTYLKERKTKRLGYYQLGDLL